MDLYDSLQGLWRRVPESYRQRAGEVRFIRAGLARIAATCGSHDQIYDAAYFQCVERKASTSAPIMAASIVRDFAPHRVLDVGCGTGALLMELRAAGVEGEGLEYSRAALEVCERRGLVVRRFDLEQRGGAPPPGRYDVAVSMEVAEHLPERVADAFVDVLSSAADTIVFTAATPGQGGHDHVNEQPHDYWISKFADRGFAFDDGRSLDWRSEWTARDVTWFYCRNLMIFRR